MKFNACLNEKLSNEIQIAKMNAGELSKSKERISQLKDSPGASVVA